MSGNEITAGIHNFFDENSSHQSQVADYDQANAGPPFQTPFGIGLSQFHLKQHFDRSQSKNQQLNLNELMHASTTLQGRSNQAKFQRDGAIPDNLGLMQRGFANFGSQEGSSPGYGSGFPGSLEKPDVTLSPVGFDFLGGHQQMNSPYAGMPPPHQRQQQSSNDLQWKQHLIAMQMQEIQRQQQLQQLHFGARQHHSFSSMYGSTGQGSADELPGMLSSMPIANAANYMPSELVGSHLKSPNSSHMFVPGNMNWAQRSIPMMHGMPNGLIYAQDQAQALHAMGYGSRQLDQSLHGTPVSGGIGSLNPFFQLQGMATNDGASVDLMSKLGANHVERASMQSSTFNGYQNDHHAMSNEGFSGASLVAGRQGAQGKVLFGNALVQGNDGGGGGAAASGSIHQSNQLTESVQVEEFHGGQEQTNWLGKSHESVAAQVPPSHVATSLDPTEEKILFGVDDNPNWDVSIGGSSSRAAGSYLNGFSLPNNDCLNVFPSLQSGTWSALVQEALEVSSSDTGQQEEWSGLSLQKAEPQTGSHSGLLSDNGKQNAVQGDEGDLHNTCSLRSKPFPPLNDSSASQSFNIRLETDLSIQSAQQLSKEANEARYVQNYQPYNFIGNNIQERQQQMSANCAWAVEERQQAMTNIKSSELESNSQGMPDSWIHQQKMPFYNMNNQLSNKLSGWGIESPSSSGSRNFKNDENGDLNQYARSLGKVGEAKDVAASSSLGGTESIKPETNNQKIPGDDSFAANFADFTNPNSVRSNMVVNHQMLNRKAMHPFKHGGDHLFAKDKEANQANEQKHLTSCLQDWDPSPGYNKESGETRGHGYNHVNTGIDSNDGRNERVDSLLTRNDHLCLITGDQKFLDRPDQKPLGSNKFQFHTMRNPEMNMEPANQESHKPHPMIWGSKNHEKENIGNSLVDVGKDCYVDLKKNSGSAEIPNAGKFSGHNPDISSFSATAAHFPQENRIGFPSQNVHAQFDKLDNSDNHSNAAKQNILENNSLSDMPDEVASNRTISHLQYSQANPLQGIGLKSVHPSQRQSAVGNSSTMHSPAEGAHRPWSTSSTSAVALPTIHETSKMDYNQNIKDALYSNTKGSSLGMIANNRNQQQQQQQSISYASRQAQFDQSDVDRHPKHLHSPAPDDHDNRSPANEASQPLFPSMSAKVPARTRLTSPIPSQIYSQENAISETKNMISDGRNASQLLHAVETVSANHHFAASAPSQQGQYVNIFNNVWRNAAAQQLSGLQPQKLASNLLQSFNPLQPPHPDDQCVKKGENASSEVVSCSINSQQLAFGEENQLKGSIFEHKQAAAMDGPSEVLNQESNLSTKTGKSVDNQREKTTFPTTTPSTGDIPKNSYSLLQQMQAMKGTDSVSTKIGRESDAGSQPIDVKMLSFFSKVIEERSANASSQLIIGELPSYRPTLSSVQHEIQNNSLSNSALDLPAKNERPSISPQMAPSWFEQYGSCKDSQASGMSDSHGKNSKAAAQNYFFAKTCEQIDNDAVAKRRGDAISESSSPTAVAADCHLSPRLRAAVTDESLVSARKKRKLAAPDLLSWHKGVAPSSRSLQFSLATMEWAQATNRLIDKIEDDTEIMDDVSSIIRPKKRLVITTQLMQQLFPPLPAKFLFEDSATSYEKVIYYLTKLTLGEVCSLISVLGADSGLLSENRNMISEKHNMPKKKREEFFLNIVDNFFARMRKLQSSFLRLEGGSSILDYRMECQDVERGSIINRFAKFHGRGPADGAEGSSASETAPRRSFPLRNVTVMPMPRNLPDGVNCLSL